LRLRAVGTYNVTEDDLSLISKFPSIEWLSLDARLRDEGMEQVARLRNLKDLQLEAPHLTDRGLAHAADLHKLESLVIGSARITDAGHRPRDRLASGSASSSEDSANKLSVGAGRARHC
jgi:hypothetical protein